MSGPLDEYRARLREALGIITDLKTRLSAAEREKSEPIAVIGMACRFPGGAHTRLAQKLLLAECSGQSASLVHP